MGSSAIGNKRTVLKTIRISQELDNLLQKDAKAKGMNVMPILIQFLQNTQNGIGLLKSLAG